MLSESQEVDYVHWTLDDYAIPIWTLRQSRKPLDRDNGVFYGDLKCRGVRKPLQRGRSSHLVAMSQTGLDSSLAEKQGTVRRFLNAPSPAGQALNGFASSRDVLSRE